MENDKTYLVLTLLTFIALLGAFGLALAEWKEYTDYQPQSFKVGPSPG